jgi:hypothetical protein
MNKAQILVRGFMRRTKSMHVECLCPFARYAIRRQGMKPMSQCGNMAVLAGQPPFQGCLIHSHLSVDGRCNTGKN